VEPNINWPSDSVSSSAINTLTVLVAPNINWPSDSAPSSAI